MCVHAMVYVAFWVCAHSYQLYTCGQASVRHVNGARHTPTMPKQHDDVTNKMDVASPTQGKRRQGKARQ